MGWLATRVAPKPPAAVGREGGDSLSLNLGGRNGGVAPPYRPADDMADGMAPNHCRIIVHPTLIKFTDEGLEPPCFFGGMVGDPFLLAVLGALEGH